MAGGYEKLVLYGTSYGTKVAEEYAQAYPSHVEALVLDSVVPPNGPEPLNRATFAAVPRILRQLCAARACARITPNPVADLTRLVRRLGARAAARPRGSTATASPTRCAISSDGLLGTLVEGDLEPTLRSEFPAAVRSAVQRRHGAAGAPRGTRGRWRRRRSGNPERELRQPALLRDDLRRASRSRGTAPSAPATRLAEAQAADQSAAGERSSRRSPRRTCSTSATSRRAPSGRSPRPRPRSIERAVAERARR